MRALMVAQIKRVIGTACRLCLPFTLDARLGIIMLYGAAVGLAAKALNARQALADRTSVFLRTSDIRQQVRTDARGAAGAASQRGL